MASDVLSLLTIDGKAKKNSDLPDLSDAELREMYRLMVLTRTLDDRGMNLQRQGRIGFYLPSRGEEGLQVGCASALRDDDWLYPSYRIPGTALVRGVDPAKLFHQIFGNSEDTSMGRQMPVHYSFKDANFVSISSPIGTHITQAVGTGMGMKYEGKDSVVATFFGDGGTSSEGFHMGMNFGAVYDAPVIFFCQNNQWAISVPFEKQTRSGTVAIKAKAYGMPGIRVDGNDILAVYKVMTEAVARARAGDGPTLIEALTFRMGPHSSSDDPSRYRPDELVADWQKKDPIFRFQRFLASKKLWDEDFERECIDGAKEEISAAIKTAEAVGPPELSTMFTDVYATMPADLAVQRDGLLRAQEAGQLTGKDEGYFPL